MFHTPTDTRMQISPSVERLMAFVGVNSTFRK